jgi:hypothetical protein
MFFGDCSGEKLSVSGWVMEAAEWSTAKENKFLGKLKNMFANPQLKSLPHIMTFQIGYLKSSSPE